MNVLSVRDLTVSYGQQRVLDGLSLDIAEGVVHGVIGHTGAGKTTLIAAILGLLPPQALVESGNIEMFGNLVAPGSKRLRALRHVTVAYVPQHARSALHPYLTIRDSLQHVLAARGRDRDDGAMIELLARVQLGDPGRVLLAYPHQLSGGMAQRVAIAMAMVCDPELVIADEPTSGLDVTVQRAILDLLLGVGERRTLVLVSHDLAVVGRHCTFLSVLHDGTVVEDGAAEDVLRAPEHPVTQLMVTP